MWTADSDYPTAPCVIEALHRAADYGIFGYYRGHDSYNAAIRWWMRERHGWSIEPDWIVPTQGLGHAIAQCVDLWTDPGASVVIFTPVYHEFRNKVERLGRQVLECPLRREGDRYALDLEDAQARLTGQEQMLIWCSPQNPSGRIWTPDELRAVAAFAERNGLMLVSDEVHQDIVFAGNTFVPMHVAAPEAAPRLVVAAAASKTFNVAGQKTGNLIIPDPDLRQAMRRHLAKADYQPGMLGLIMTEAAYSARGRRMGGCAERASRRQSQALRRDAARDPGRAVAALAVDLPGLGGFLGHRAWRSRKSMPACGGRRASPPALDRRFGTGGESFLRFNLATPRARVEEAGRRLQRAFADLQ